MWSDEYTGERWTYGLSYRPLGTATVPAGWLIDTARSVPNLGFAHGTVDYPRQLTEQEVAAYELTPCDAAVTPSLRTSRQPAAK